MLIKEIVPTEQVIDVLCDVCGRSTKTTFGTNQYGSLSADFGYGSVTMVSVIWCICVKCVFSVYSQQ